MSLSLQAISDAHGWTTSPRYQSARQAHERALEALNRSFGAYRALADIAARTEDESARTALYKESDERWRDYVRASLALEEAGNELLRASRGTGMTHTPGEWSVVQGDVVDSVGLIAQVWGVEPRRDGREVKANAVLMSAAPDLLAACKLAVKSWFSGEVSEVQMELVLRHAIAKAEGK